jgi:hypothetical protein
MFDKDKFHEWLGTLHSHGVYSESHLDRLKDAGFEYDPKTETLGIGNLTGKICVQTEEEIRNAIASRGLGGWVDLNGGRGITGWIIAQDLCRVLGLGNPGGMFMGRGTRHDACIMALKRFSPEPESDPS